MIKWIDDVQRDAKYAVRSLARTPTFTAVAVLTLGLGIGANSAIFSVINSVLLKPLPYPDSDRLVRLMMSLPAAASPSGAPLRVAVGISGAEAAQIQAQSTTLSDVVIATPTLVGLSGYEDGARLQGANVSASALRMLGVQPVLGRLFTPDDELAGASQSVLVAYSAWQRYFGGDPNIVGRSLTFDAVLGPRRQTLHTVVGVMPDGFEFPRADTQFWLPLTPPAGGRGVARGAMLGKLRPGISREAATGEIAPVIRAIRQGQRGNDVAVYELSGEQDEIVAPVRPALLVLSGAVAFVLLIACINVANLLLARANTRRPEMAIRSALGAGRGRLIRQALTESIVLGVLGGMVGTTLAFGGVWLLRRLATTLGRVDLVGVLPFPRLDEIAVDWRTLAVTIAVSVAAGILFGLVPAVRYSSSNQAESLKKRGRTPLRKALVVAEVSLSLVLLVGAGLLIHSFARLSTVNTGYDASGVLTFQVALPVDGYPTARLKQFAEDLIARLEAVPGVQAAAYANQLPLIGIRDTGGGLWRTPDPQRGPAPPPGQDLRIVSRAYLDAMRIRVVAGRGFADSDGPGRPRVLLINETLARQEFPGQSPLGRLVYIGRDVMPWEIIGIVSDVRQFGIDQAPQPQMFADMRQWSNEPLVFMTGAYYVVRTAGNPASLVPGLRGVVAGVDPAGKLFNVAPMEQLVSTTIARPRMYAVLLGVFAAVGVALAVIGIYGMLAYSVAQRTREIGIRVALGAQRSQVLRLVLGQSLVVTGIGLVIGLAGAAMLSRYLERLLFGLTPFDLSTFAAVALLFCVVAAIASYAPARRAANVDPIVALRCE